MAVPTRKTVAADGESGGVPVTVLKVFDPSVTSNVDWPAGTGPQLLPREYLPQRVPRISAYIRKTKLAVAMAAPVGTLAK